MCLEADRWWDRWGITGFRMHAAWVDTLVCSRKSATKWKGDRRKARPAMAGSSSVTSKAHMRSQCFSTKSFLGVYYSCRPESVSSSVRAYGEAFRSVRLYGGHGASWWHSSQEGGGVAGTWQTFPGHTLSVLLPPIRFYLPMRSGCCNRVDENKGKFMKNSGVLPGGNWAIFPLISFDFHRRWCLATSHHTLSSILWQPLLPTWHSVL